MKYRGYKFGKAAISYHQASSVQKEMAEILCGFLPESIPTGNILELGCGTGHLSRLLLEFFPKASLTLSDIAPEMLQQCFQLVPIGDFKGSVTWECIDAESSWGKESLSLICSNALIQWISNLTAHLQEAAKCLVPGGYYLFSGFSDDNFPELKTLLRRDPFCFTTFPGYPLEKIKEELQSTGFTPIKYMEQKKQIYYPSFIIFLKKLKEIGANGRKNIIMTRGRLNFLKEQYTRLNGIGNNVLATWKPWFCLAQKEPSTEK